MMTRLLSWVQRLREQIREAPSHSDTLLDFALVRPDPGPRADMIDMRRLRTSADIVVALGTIGTPPTRLEVEDRDHRVFVQPSPVPIEAAGDQSPHVGLMVTNRSQRDRGANDHAHHLPSIGIDQGNNSLMALEGLRPSRYLPPLNPDETLRSNSRFEGAPMLGLTPVTSYPPMTDLRPPGIRGTVPIRLPELCHVRTRTIRIKMMVRKAVLVGSRARRGG